jgi:hypothetical protein
MTCLLNEGLATGWVESNPAIYWYDWDFEICISSYSWLMHCIGICMSSIQLTTLLRDTSLQYSWLMYWEMQCSCWILTLPPKIYSPLFGSKHLDQDDKLIKMACLLNEGLATGWVESNLGHYGWLLVWIWALGTGLQPHTSFMWMPQGEPTKCQTQHCVMRELWGTSTKLGTSTAKWLLRMHCYLRTMQDPPPTDAIV